MRLSLPLGLAALLIAAGSAKTKTSSRRGTGRIFRDVAGEEAMGRGRWRRQEQMVLRLGLGPAITTASYSRRDKGEVLAHCARPAAICG